LTLIVVDFDGTITERDTLVMLVQTHAPDVFDEVEDALHEGRITLRECIRREFEAVRGDHDTIIAEAVAETRVRPGFAGFVAAARAAGDRLVVVSSGFESIIRPVLAREGVGDLDVVAHEVRFTAAGGVVDFRHGEDCDLCGEQCKRSVVTSMRGDGEVVYIGDGYSDRCAALAADRVFARRGLARYLTAAGVPFDPFEDFADVRAAMGGSYSAVV
jgi:2-hydroxy-3-keto-5-methylthiopentenyl-1-phosphate phosphatase